MTDAPHVPSVLEVRELDLTSDAIEETAHLQRHFGRREVLFFTICTVVGVDTIGAVASGGAQAFTWLLVFTLIFFVPSGLLFAELGTAFPEEGGPYLWTRLAFGRYVGAVNNFLYWVTNPVWMGGTLAIAAAATWGTFFGDGPDLGTVPFYVLGLLFIWIGTFAAILSFSVGKWIPITGAFARFIMLGFFTISVVVFAAQNGVNGVSGGDFIPSGMSDIKIGFVGLAAVIMFNYVGFELPSTAGDEMKDAQKDVPAAIFKTGIAAFLLYAVPVMGILLVLPIDQVTGLGGFIDALKSVFTVYGGSVAEDGTVELTGAGAFLGGSMAILFILCLLSSGTAWLMGSDRALAVSGYDGSAPRYLGKFSPRFGTPVRVNVLSGLLSTLVLVLAHEISDGDAAKYFGAVLGIAVSTTLISYIAVFPALWKLRSKFPDHPRPFRAPWAPFLSILLTGLIVVATIQIMLPGIGDDWFGEGYAPDGWTQDERWKYFLTEALPLLSFVIIGSLFYVSGKKTRGDVGEVAVEAALEEGAKAE
ncbi:MAG TPA: APC family permease [Candidatus Limnocylindria bacterium]|nr:APC family permease [Candidatus Limnocylindria bacterium]